MSETYSHPELLSSLRFKMESCARRHDMCNQWWDPVRQQEVNQVLTGQSSQANGNKGRHLMQNILINTSKEKKEEKKRAQFYTEAAKEVREFIMVIYMAILMCLVLAE